MRQNARRSRKVRLSTTSDSDGINVGQLNSNQKGSQPSRESIVIDTDEDEEFEIVDRAQPGSVNPKGKKDNVRKSARNSILKSSQSNDQNSTFSSPYYSLNVPLASASPGAFPVPNIPQLYSSSMPPSGPIMINTDLLETIVAGGETTKN